MNFILSTRNPKKTEELKAVLNRVGHQLISLEEYEQREGITIPEVEETADDFYGNALLKAEALFEHVEHVNRSKKKSDNREIGAMGVIADDSGLVVPLLGGEPGVHSARYAGIDSPDKSVVYRANIDKLHRELRRHPEYHRETPAYFLTVIVLLRPEKTGRKIIVGEGRCQGRIIDEVRGEKGFGYDPIFVSDDNPENLTFAEMSSENKNAISHRSRAIEKVIDQLGK